MKIFFTFLLTLTTSFVLFAQPQMREETKLLKTLYYERNVYIATEQEQAKLNELIAQMRADTTLIVRIVGSCDRTGGVIFNEIFSLKRATWVADFMSTQGVRKEQMECHGVGIDITAANSALARRVDISRVVREVIKPEPISEQPQEPQEPQMTQEPKMIPNPQEPQIPQKEIKVQKIELRTNLLYWAGGLMNIGLEWRPNNTQLGVVLNGGYSFLGNTNWYYNLGGWFVAPELRYYIPRNEQWFVGVQFLGGGYNIKLSEEGNQGIVMGGGVMGGYKLSLSELFDMDFTLGVGYGNRVYDTYNHYNITNVNIRTNRDISKSSVIPIQAGVNLIWKIN